MSIKAKLLTVDDDSGDNDVKHIIERIIKTS